MKILINFWKEQYSCELREIDSSVIAQHYYLKITDQCCYLFNYFSGLKSDAGKGNDIICNLKKDVDRKGKREYEHKINKMNEIATILADNFDPNSIEYTFVPIPPSKCKTDPLYDDKMYQILSSFRSKFYIKNKIKINIRELLVQTKSYPSAHISKNRPSIGFYTQIYRINNNATEPVPQNIILFDDVITAGAHFKAAQHVIKKFYREEDINIIGFFIARTTRQQQ